MRSWLGSTALIALISSQAIAQGGFKWFVGAGPSAVTQRGYSILGPDPFNVSAATDTFLLSGAEGRAAATLGVARRLAGSALNLRVDGTYQLATSDSGTAHWPFGQIIRAALRDESISANAGLEWNAIPNGAWSPYLVTSFGTIVSRLRWNSDSSVTRSNRTTFTRALTAHVGFGVRGTMLGTTVFVESRRQWWTTDWASSRMLPLVVGIRMR